MQLEEQSDVRADRARGYNYFGKISQPSKIVLIIRVSQRITSIRNNKRTERNNMSYYPQTIANKMEKGLTKEIEMYTAISKALREDGNSKSQVSYYMSVDEDFIPDVLQAYASIVTAPIHYCQCEACTA